MSKVSAESEDRYEQEKDENKTQLMDESSFRHLLLSSNEALCRKFLTCLKTFTP